MSFSGLVSVMVLLAALDGQPPAVRTVENVNLDRYLGDWFEIARYPNRFQRRCTGNVRASYARRPDGRLDVINRCRTAEGAIEARGVARVVDARTSAKLKVRFAPAALSLLPFVWGDYWILGLADDYSWAVVGSPDRKYLWLLARAPAASATAARRRTRALSASSPDELARHGRRWHAALPARASARNVIVAVNSGGQHRTPESARVV